MREEIIGDARLILGDCLEVLPGMEAGSVDAIITDIPYGTTACSWDTIIPFPDLWRVVKHILKPRGVFVTTASQPFTSALVMSNPGWFRYEWIWDKKLPTGFLDANRKPMKRHENIIIFAAGKHTYNPQKWHGKPYKKGKRALTSVYSEYRCEPGLNETGERYPTTILEFSNANRNGDGHPTQKPVALYEYLIYTYTGPGELVADITMGSGTTGVAALRLSRKFIGIEIAPEYFDIACRRIEQENRQLKMF